MAEEAVGSWDMLEGHCGPGGMMQETRYTAADKHCHSELASMDSKLRELVAGRVD
jgi:hypothetical protein